MPSAFLSHCRCRCITKRCLDQTSVTTCGDASRFGDGFLFVWGIPLPVSRNGKGAIHSACPLFLVLISKYRVDGKNAKSIFTITINIPRQRHCNTFKFFRYRASFFYRARWLHPRLTDRGPVTTPTVRSNQQSCEKESGNFALTDLLFP